MGYSTASPPSLVTMGPLTGAGKIWLLTGTDLTGTVDTAGYITNGLDLGMKVGDTLIYNQTLSKITYTHYVVTVSATAPGVVDLSDGTVIGSVTNTD